MSWKHVKRFKTKSMSLVTKLMLLYSISTLALLSATGLFLYPTFIKLIEHINNNQAVYFTAVCNKRLIITLLIGSLSAIIFGHFIARNGLKRLREFETKMEKITVDSLHERIDLTEWPKELTSLGNKFNTMLDRIQTSFTQINQFSSDIAHELRTPIHNLRGITEIALANGNYDEKSQELLEKHMTEYLHLSKLIENLLFLARSDHGHIELNKEEINAKSEILNICDYYQAIADENEIIISCEGDSHVMVDLTLFKRVISNVVTNALKYTPRQGKISIKIGNMADYSEISIHDNGIGIMNEHLEKISDRFYRVDSSRSQHSGGLGLGLAIVKSIMELHKGKLVIKSNINQGTSVYLYFPLP